ncbi:MAG: HD-GYP domain-containing protein [Desulfovibrio sp.]|nr:HD-GYP domain-containing protein [Desulfovibrio sp.]
MAAVKISVNDLRPGMYIIDSGLPWLEHPYLYAEEGLIRSLDQICEILKQGFSEAYYDPERSHFDPPLTANDINKFTSSPLEPPAPKVSLSQGLKKAQKIYGQCVTQVRKFLSDARVGKIEFEESTPLVTGIIEGLNDNADALVSLSKIKTYDEYTFTHCVNVAVLSAAFGRFLGIEGERLHRLTVAGLYHDIGKMRVPVDILNAPRKLTEQEFQIMKMHTLLVDECLPDPKRIDQEVLRGIKEHHEKYDGSGYPRHLAGDDISLFGQLISIADIYDALSSVRVYKDAMPPPKALSLMFEMHDRCWKPTLVENFIKMIGIYPVGTPVKLTRGFVGVVTKSNPQLPLRPAAVIVQNPNGQDLTPRIIDLSMNQNISIMHALSPKEKAAAHLDVLSILTDNDIK